MNIKTENKLETTVALGLTTEMKSEIVRISQKRDISQQKVIRMMIDLGLDCHRDMEKVGLIAAVDFTYYVKQALKKRIEEGGKKQLALF